MNIGYSIVILILCGLCITLLAYIGFLIINRCILCINYSDERDSKLPLYNNERSGSYVKWNSNEKIINYNALM